MYEQSFQNFHVMQILSRESGLHTADDGMLRSAEQYAYPLIDRNVICKVFPEQQITEKSG